MKYQARCHCGKVAFEFDGEGVEGIDLDALPVKHFDGRSI